MSKNMLDGGQVIVDYLVREKVPYVFGLCGHGNIGFIDALYVNFYAQSEGEAKLAGTTVKLVQATDYPWVGAVKLAVTPARPRSS